MVLPSSLFFVLYEFPSSPSSSIIVLTPSELKQAKQENKGRIFLVGVSQLRLLYALCPDKRLKWTLSVLDIFEILNRPYRKHQLHFPGDVSSFCLLPSLGFFRQPHHTQMFSFDNNFLNLFS